MKQFYFLITIFLCACTESVQDKASAGVTDSIRPGSDVQGKDGTLLKERKAGQRDISTTNRYSNTRFKEVTVTRSGDDQYTVQGKAQIFEANFGWVLLDGDKAIKQGFQMTDAGAPEWGNFNFTIDVANISEGSKLTLVLFEVSAKDGSRQYELPILLSDQG